MKKLIPLTAIILDAGTQVRAQIHEDTVEDYAEAYKAKAKFPAVDVFVDGNRYLLADGFHRVLGATKAGLKTIEAELHAGTRADCIKFALGSNINHGLRRTNVDKRHGVEIALKEFKSLADRAIADLCAVSHTFVAEIREHQLATVASCAPVSASESTKVETRIGRDGKERKIPIPTMPPPIPKPVQTAPSGPPPAKSKATPPPPPAPLPPIAQREAQPPLKDKTGCEIPHQLDDLWCRSGEIQEMLTQISKLKTALERAQESRDLLYRPINFSSAIANFKQAYTDVKTAMPYAVCPYCAGRNRDNCPNCHQRGFVSEFFWSTAIPEEFKTVREKVNTSK